jgi:hypothetical protein
MVLTMTAASAQFHWVPYSFHAMDFLPRVFLLGIVDIHDIVDARVCEFLLALNF